MRPAGLVLLHLTLLASGCSTGTEYMVHYRSVAPFHPDDPNELLAELTGRLPATVEIRHFLHKQRADEMRGIVLVRGARARDAVCNTIRNNPRLQLAGEGPERVHSAGKSLICFASRPPFMPDDENELLAELQRGLPPGVSPAILRSRRGNDGITLWILVKGNFGREVVKFTIQRNPNLKLLQVEETPPLPFLSPGWRTR
jgi:hypothetical protein